MKMEKMKSVVMLVLLVVGMSYGTITTTAYYNMDGNPAGMDVYGTPTVTGDAPAGAGSGSTASVNVDGDDWYNLGSNPLPGADNYGIEVWAKADALDGFNFLVAAGTNYGGISLVQVGNQMGVLAQGAGWAVPVVYDIVIGEWHHYAAVSNGGTVEFYVDGILIDSGANNAKPIQDSFTIGANDKVDGGSAGSATPTFEGAWKGSIDDVHVFGFEAGQFDAADLNSIPEPATLCLLGLGGLSLIRRKRN